MVMLEFEINLIIRSNLKMLKTKLAIYHDVLHIIIFRKHVLYKPHNCYRSGNIMLSFICSEILTAILCEAKITTQQWHCKS